MENLHVAAFLAHQQELDERDRVPVLFYEDSEDREALRRWFEKHRPEVILSTALKRETLTAAGIVAPRDAGWAKLLLWDATEGVAGVLPGYERLGAAAVDLLAGQLHHDAYGAPADPKVVLVEGVWCDGGTLGRGDPRDASAK